VEPERGGQPIGGVLDRLAFFDCDIAGERGLREIEPEGAPIAARNRFGIDAARDYRVSLRDGEVDLRGKAVSRISAYGKPARGVEEECVIRLDGGEFDAVDG